MKRMGKKKTEMMPKRNTAQTKHLITKKRECVCYNRRIFGKETNFHHFYSISFLSLSSREMPSFNFLIIPKEVPEATAILTQFFVKRNRQNTGWRQFVYTYHQCYLAVRAPFSKYYPHQPSLRWSRQLTTIHF